MKRISVVLVLVVALISAACSDKPAASPASPAAPTSTSALPVTTTPATTVPSIALASPSAASSPTAAPGPYDWSYSGDTGPDHWADLSPSYYACRYGVEQSPIEITGSDEMRERDPIFDYHEGPTQIWNEDWTIKAVPIQRNTVAMYHFYFDDPDAPEPVTIPDDSVYVLRELRFHVPAEHKRYGTEAYPAEVQFIHQHATGAQLVVGAWITEGPEDNAAWAPYIDAMTTAPQVEKQIVLDWSKLLPTQAEFGSWRYDGSLTTPPCTERVEWVFLHDPVSLSAAQIAKMRAAYDGNARPIQPFNMRTMTDDLTGD